MARILLLPLDERPCNHRFPQMMAQGCGDIELVMPPRSLLGNKKRPAGEEGIARWLWENFGTCDYAVLSIDMLVYGGIVPSRLHSLERERCLVRLAALKQLRTAYPRVKIFAFSLIMRAPAYSSSEEEPDYYAEYGAQLCRLGVLRDKAARGAEAEAEHAELKTLERLLPPAVLNDFCGRRAVNHAVNECALALLEQHVLDFLVIPLDDCAECGWAAAEQRALRAHIAEAKLGARAYVYAGADEVGCVLLARAANHSRGRSPAVYLQYSSVCGPFVTPKYEDRPLGENLKWQIAAAGGRTVPVPEAADLVLMVNAPTAGGSRMAEAGAADRRHASYFNCRCLPDFAANMRAFIREAPVALADVAMANGGDAELMQLLAEEGLLPRLASYAAWNTAANAAGTCIAHAMLCLRQGADSSLFTTHRMLEDWAYMADIRQRAQKMAGESACAFDRGDEEACLAAFVRRELEKYLTCYRFPATVEIGRVGFPWHRFFEIELSLTEGF